MAKFFQVAGQPIGLRRNDREETLGPIPGGAAVVELDAATNAALFADFDRNHNAYSISGGVLKKDGANVSIQADGADKQDRDDFRTQLANALARVDQIIGATFANNAQRDAAIQDLARIQKRLLKRLAIIIRDGGF